MRSASLAMTIGLVVALCGCGQKVPVPKPEETPTSPVKQQPAPTATVPPIDTPPKGADESDPSITYHDPAFTALFPTSGFEPKRDANWEKDLSTSSGLPGVRVIRSMGRGMTCRITVFPTTPFPQDFEKDVDKAMEMYVASTSGKNPAKALMQAGKFPARQVVEPLVSGKQVSRTVYAYKRLYELVIGGTFVESENDAVVKKFMDSFSAKE